MNAMIANLTRGAETASLHLPADRFQIAGVLSYLGVDRLDDYELLCEGQDSSGSMMAYVEKHAYQKSDNEVKDKK